MGSQVDDLLTVLRSSSSVTSVVVDEGGTLITQGDDSDTVYVLVDGALRVSRDLDGATAVVAVVDAPGTVIGEMVAMGGGRRTATVTATAPTTLLSLGIDDFSRLLEENGALADLLVEVAIRRAEEGELAELLASHFGIVDEGTLVATCSSVRWRRLSAGETLVEEGAPSDSVFFVVRGRLATTRHDPTLGAVKIGEVGRGDVVGEVGLLRGRPRAGTVTAIRDTVVAEMSELTFQGLIKGQPQMMIELFLGAVARSESPRWHSAPATVLGVIASEAVDSAAVAAALAASLGRYGEVRRLSAALVDATLDHPGIAGTMRGTLEDVRLSRLVHEAELAADYVVVEVGDTPGPWARRALGMIDHLLVCVEDGVGHRELDALSDLAGLEGVGSRRTLVIQRSGPEAPSGSAAQATRLGATGVIQTRRGSASDMDRLARVAVGRANALVMSGGGGRGFAHIGVYRAMLELGMTVDMVVGSSMGGVLGAVMADRLTPEEIVTWAEERFPSSLDYTLPVVSLVKGERIARYAREKFGDRDIEDLRVGFCALSTDLTTSRPHLHETGSVVLAIRATSAIPGVMPPVPHGDALLIDGGVLNNLPIDVARSRAPAGIVVASDVAPPRGPGAHGDYGLHASGWKALRSRWGSRRSPYPGISAVLMRSMITASMRERDSQVGDGLADCYLDLDVRGVSMLDFSDPRSVANRGYESAMPALEAWLSDHEPMDPDSRRTAEPMHNAGLHLG